MIAGDTQRMGAGALFAGVGSWKGDNINISVHMEASDCARDLAQQI